MLVYLRHATRRKDGKTHVYWQLVRSVRRGRKVVQETVAQLGELDAEGRARAEALARSITGRACESSQGQLFDRTEPRGSVAVKLDAVRLERSRSFGAVWLGWLLWRALKLDELCGALLASKREMVSWAEVVAILVIGRLCEPSSELHVAERWYRTTALEDLLGVATESLYDERLYRALDRLLPHKEAIEQHLVKRLGELFDLDYDLLIYDITSTYFEGVADPTIAKRGYSRDHRPDCVQVNIALVVSREGMPLGYEIFAGNITDVTTVKQIVEGMESRFGKVNRVWVMDRGMVSAKNIAWLNATGRRYVIGTARAELSRWAKEMADKTAWRQIREDVEVKICRGPETGARLSFCVARRAAWRKRRPCMNVSLSASKKDFSPSPDASRRAKPNWSAASWNARLGDFWSETPGLARGIRSWLPRIPVCLRDLSLSGAHVRSGTIGLRSVKAPTSCAATSRTGLTRNCGKLISSSRRLRRPSVFRSPTCASVRFGITNKGASRRTFSSAFSPTLCGKRSRSGSHVPGWATRLARS